MWYTQPHWDMPPSGLGVWGRFSAPFPFRSAKGGCAGLRGGDTQRKTEDKSDRYALWQFMYSVQFSLFILISEPWKVRWKVPANIPSQQRQGNVRCKQGRRPGPSSPRALGAPIPARGISPAVTRLSHCY